MPLSLSFGIYERLKPDRFKGFENLCRFIIRFRLAIQVGFHLQINGLTRVSRNACGSDKVQLPSFFAAIDEQLFVATLASIGFKTDLMLLSTLAVSITYAHMKWTFHEKAVATTLSSFSPVAA